MNEYLPITISINHGIRTQIRDSGHDYDTDTKMNYTYYYYKDMKVMIGHIVRPKMQTNMKYIKL